MNKSGLYLRSNFMRWYVLLANKFSANNTKSFSRSITRLAILTVALSVAIMLLSIATVTEFQKAIKDKIIGLNGDILIESLENVQRGEQNIFANNDKSQLKFLDTIPNIKKITFILNKPAIVRGKEEIEGVVAQAVDDSYDFEFIGQFITKGRKPNFTKDSNEVLISAHTQKNLGVKIGERIQILFFRNDDGGTRARALNPRVVGIFNTGISEYDKRTLCISKRSIARILPINESFSQVEVSVKVKSVLDKTLRLVEENLDPQFFQVRSSEQRNWQIFEWLKILDTNVWVIIAIMVLVAAITMCTTVLIIITEKTNTIGMLKAMGATNAEIRKLFVFQSGRIAFWGLLFGNAVALILGYTQKYTKAIKLNADTYYLDHVVVSFKLQHIILINSFSFLLIVLIMFIPVSIISKFNPIKSIRFN